MFESYLNLLLKFLPRPTWWIGNKIRTDCYLFTPLGPSFQCGTCFDGLILLAVFSALGSLK